MHTAIDFIGLAAAAAIATTLIAFFSITSRHKIGYTILIWIIGAGAFGAAFLGGKIFAVLTLHYTILNAVMEECLKLVCILISCRFARPVGITAAFAGVEVLVKVYTMWNAPEFKWEIYEIYLPYLSIGIISAYLMHISTGLFYRRIGIAGFIAAAVAHSLYNLIGFHFDHYATLSDGLVLLVISSALVAAGCFLAKIALARTATEPRLNENVATTRDKS
jgi:hypothetical protein